jgi:RNA polymerase sigma-70 factor (family 1)
MDPFSHNKNWLLLSSLKKGNIGSFESLYKSYQPKIFAFSLRYLKVVEDAEGITQEVFIELWKNREKIDVNLSLSSFLFTIAKNKIIDHFRKQKKETLFNNYLQHYVDFTGSINIDNTGNNVIDKQILTAIKKLPPKRKIVFLLSKKFGLSRKETADFLGISENTVKNQLQEAIKYLRHLLRRETVLIIFFLLKFF